VTQPEGSTPELTEAYRLFQSDLATLKATPASTEAEHFQKQEITRVLTDYTNALRQLLTDRGVKLEPELTNNQSAKQSTSPNSNQPLPISRRAIDAELRKLLHLKPSTPAAPILKPGGPGASAPTSGESLKAQEQQILDRARKMQAAYEAKQEPLQRAFRRASR
jgi:hypothetical protein